MSQNESSFSRKDQLSERPQLIFYRHGERRGAIGVERAEAKMEETKEFNARGNRLDLQESNRSSCVFINIIGDL